jgi:erythronate-4-phosphate dehydrogenase
LCIHANLHETPPYPSVNLITTAFFSKLKPGTVIINAARGGIIDEQALLTSKNPITYCTDVYQHEPHVHPAIIDYATLCTPHIAGHSIEAKTNAVEKISQQLHAYYGISLPTPVISNANRAPSYQINSSIPNWQDMVLNIFNPFEDTGILKKASDKSKAFLIRRQAHQSRHDFSCYNLSDYNPQIRQLFGQ